MDFSRLLRDELVYELKVRGVVNIAGETVRTMRLKLKDLTENENFGVIVKDDSFEPDIAEELNICNEKIVSLEEYLNTHVIIKQNSHEARYVDAKICHLYSRLCRLIIPEDEESREFRDSCSNLRKQLGELEERLDLKLNSEEIVVVDQNAIAASTSTVTTTAVYKTSSTPVYKWDISFSGKPNTMSVNAFLERVGEYKKSRRVSDQELLDSVEDLLRDKALLWYRAVRHRIRTWVGFVEEFRTEYLGHDYQNNLWDEIRKREQRSHERVGEYFACMINMFNRLPQKPTEEEKLSVLHRNIESYYIDRLGLAEIKNVQDLLEKCKKLEISRDLANKSKPSSKVCCLEPDLACDSNISNSPPTNRTNCQPRSIASIKCWNCDVEGHSFAKCTKPRAKQFCFRCGKPNVTKYSCSCHPKNGARDRRHTGRRSQN